jgi:hypothetical protein
LFDFILHIFSKRDPWLELEKGAIKGPAAKVKRYLIIHGSWWSKKIVHQEDSHATRGSRWSTVGG